MYIAVIVIMLKKIEKGRLSSFDRHCFYANVEHTYSIQIWDLDHFLFLEAFDNFLEGNVPYNVDIHQKNLNSARVFQENNSFAHFYFLVLLLYHLRLQT